MNTSICFARRRSWLPSVAPIALATSLACSKSPPSDAASSPSASASVASSSLHAAPSASAPTAPSSTTWTGAYTAKVGAVDPPKNANEKTWTNDPGSAAVGKGTIELSIGAPRGDVTGEAKGPLGDIIVAGTFDGHELRANLAPRDPNADGAMTGFMVLTGENAEPLKGTMRVAGKDGRIVREALVELSKK